MRRIGLAVVVCIAGIALSVSASAFELNILSGTYGVNEVFQGWFSTSDRNVVGDIGSLTTPGAWTQVKLSDGSMFDQSKWGRAVVVTYDNIRPQTIVPETKAQFMWGGTPKPTGTNGPNEAFFRFNFTLPGPEPPSLSLRIIADDRYDLFFNGRFVGAETLENHMAKDRITPIPIEYKLTGIIPNNPDLNEDGKNVLAIRARDGGPIPGCPDPCGGSFNTFSRVNQWLWVEGTVSAPEPGTILVLGSGLLGLVGWRRKQVKSACSVGF